MIVLTIAIAGYVLGLVVFYLFAVFSTHYWPIFYYEWAKLFDVGLMFWAVLYYNGNPLVKSRVRFLYAFSFIRFLFDISSFFTGVGVNNDWMVALFFLILITIAGYLCLKNDSPASMWLSKHLFNSD